MNIDNRQDIMDSRDVIDRIEDLESTREAYEEDVTNARDALEEAEEDEDEAENLGTLQADLAAAEKALADFDEDEGEELSKLKAFADQLEGYGDWDHGETLIRESYFVEYCEELCKDIGEIPQDIPSYIVIDWDATANNLRIDYTEAELDGVKYLMRA